MQNYMTISYNAIFIHKYSLKYLLIFIFMLISVSIKKNSYLCINQVKKPMAKTKNTLLYSIK